jgi:hypothetical protein
MNYVCSSFESPIDQVLLLFSTAIIWSVSCITPHVSSKLATRVVIIKRHCALQYSDDKDQLILVPVI